MSWLVEHRFTYGWDDAGWTTADLAVGERPLRFDTEAQAIAAIDQLMADVALAVLDGDMVEPYRREDYRVREVVEEVAGKRVEKGKS